MDVNFYSYSIKYRSHLPFEKPNYVFDCRGIPNPGRVPELKSLTGMDDQVIEFIESNEAAMKFSESVRTIILDTLPVFIDRGYAPKMIIAFCCTGGRHRSVYFCEYFAKLFRSFELVKVSVQHLDVKHNYY